MVQPSIIENASKIVVIGDVHGDIERLVKMVKSIGLFSNSLEWIAEPIDTVVVQLGDQIDSLNRNDNANNQNWEQYPDVEVLGFMDRLDAIAQQASGGRGRVLSLLGNHELMNVFGLFDYVSPQSMSAVGGLPSRMALFSPGGQFAQMLANRNIVVQVGPFLFCHGGILPKHLDYVNNNFEIINASIQKFLRKEQVSPTEEYIIRDIIFNNTEGIVWLRKYIDMLNHEPQILKMVIDNICERTNTQVLFVGHNTLPEITRVADGKLYFTDAGFSRAYSLHDTYVEVVQIIKNEAAYNIETLRVFL